MSRIGMSERLAIEAGLYRQDSLTVIAKNIGVSRKSLSKELRLNRTFALAPRYNEKDCKYAADCDRRFVCGDALCMRDCVLCNKLDCRSVCSMYKSIVCDHIKKPPYVCNACQLRRGCTSDRAYYHAKQAHAMAMRRYSIARSKPQTQGDELKALDDLITPLIKEQKQPLSHIYSTYGEYIPVTVRTLYRYIEDGILSVGNIDLRRKVGYKPRKTVKKKEPSEAEKNKEYRKNRTYAHFLEYMEKHPDINYVQMDSVIGARGAGKRMLTMLFTKQNLMLIFLLRDGKADSVVDIFDWLTSALGLNTFRKLFPAILTDNGAEFKRTSEMERTIDGKTRTKLFYCDPQASWQKAQIEKNHEYIRYVLPKGKTFNPYTQDDFNLLASHINSTRRMQYDGKSPIELATSNDFKKLMDVVGIQQIPANKVMLSPRLLKRQF